MRIRLHNIGPIRDGDVSFAPLTVLVGPNGSGKTTFTTVAYAVFKAHEASIVEILELVEPPFEDEDEEGPAFQTGQVIDSWLDSFTENLAFELRRCCSPDLAMLARARRGGKNAGPRITVSTERWCLVFRLDGNEIWLETEHPDFKRPRIRIPSGTARPMARRRLRNRLTGDMPLRAIYFPAGRSGIVQTHTALSALMAGALSGGYFKDATIGAIPGATADFMQLVAQIRPRRKVRFGSRVADRLEKNLLQGKVHLTERGGRREFLFTPAGHDSDWPVENMATAVAEFTPLVLYLRHRAGPGDSILIDEPESHLHPESQVALATGLAEVATVISPVVVATHSEFLVSAFSNLILSQAREPTERRSSVDKMAVYSFSFHDQDRGRGSNVTEIDIDAAEGFAIDQFSEVAERVFDDSIRLYNELHSGDAS